MFSKYVGSTEGEIITDTFYVYLHYVSYYLKHVTWLSAFDQPLIFQWYKEGYITQTFHLLFAEPLKPRVKLWSQWSAQVPQQLTASSDSSDIKHATKSEKQLAKAVNFQGNPEKSPKTIMFIVTYKKK